MQDLQMREKMIQKFIDIDFLDTFRYFHPDMAKKYSWWSNFASSRDRNIGWRIDYFLSSASIRKSEKCFHRDEVRGSDHCPV